MNVSIFRQVCSISGDPPATGHRGHGGSGRWGLLYSLVADLNLAFIKLLYLDSLGISRRFPVCCRDFSGGFKPSPTTLSMVAGGGGLIQNLPDV